MIEQPTFLKDAANKRSSTNCCVSRATVGDEAPHGHGGLRGSDARVVDRCRFNSSLLSLAATLVVILSGCAADRPPVIDTTTRHVIQNAGTLHSGLAPAAVADGNLGTYLNAVGARLYAATKETPGADALPSVVKVDLLENDAPLAFTFGGEQVYLSTGALKLCTCEEDVAAALAHLYAHLLDRHQQAHDQIDSVDLLVVADIVTRSPMTSDQERSADRDGFLLFARGGWDPAKYADAWTRLGGHAGTSRAADISNWIATVPPPSDDWRRPPVSSRFAFRNLMRASTAVSNRPHPTAELLMRCVKSCIGDDNVVSRTAGVESLESHMKGDTSSSPLQGTTPSHVW